MKLDAHEPGMVLKFHDLDKQPVGRASRKHQARVFELLAIIVVEFEAVTVALGNDFLVVCFTDARALF